jgi:hypothetical protein
MRTGVGDVAKCFIIHILMNTSCSEASPRGRLDDSCNSLSRVHVISNNLCHYTEVKCSIIRLVSLSGKKCLNWIYSYQFKVEVYNAYFSQPSNRSHVLLAYKPRLAHTLVLVKQLLANLFLWKSKHLDIWEDEMAYRLIRPITIFATVFFGIVWNINTIPFWYVIGLFKSLTNLLLYTFRVGIFFSKT